MPTQIQPQPSVITYRSGIGFTAQGSVVTPTNMPTSGGTEQLPKQDTFTTSVPKEGTTMVSSTVLAQLLQQHQALQPAQARPAFALTTSLPEARLIKNPAARALNTVLASVGIGAVVGGVSGLLTPMFMNKKTGLWLVFGSTLGATVGAGMGLLLGYGVFGRVAEQQQETENKIHLAKTRVLVEQVTPLSLDTVPME